MYNAYCRQSAVMLYFLRATGKTLWHGSSTDTRKDLYISTCGLLEVDVVEAAEPGGPADVADGGTAVRDEDESFLSARDVMVFMDDVLEGMIVLAVELWEVMVLPELGGSSAFERLRVPFARSRSE